MFNFDDTEFLATYTTTFQALSSAAQQGLKNLLGFLAQDPDVTDVRWAAYMLATIKHECADRWQPIEEFGKGRGRPYGEPVTVKDANGVEHINTYYGRGYVQLTHKENYQKMSDKLGLGDDLLIHPERALEPEISYRIMSFGMRHGSFTGKKLGDFIHDDACDYLNARRIINALDQADRIKGYATKLESVLKASLLATPSEGDAATA